MAVFGRFSDGNGMERFFPCLCLSHRESNIRGPTPMEISMIVMKLSMGSVMEISMGPKEKMEWNVSSHVYVYLTVSPT